MPKPHQQTTWLLLSLIVPLYFGAVSLSYALSQEYIVQDDVRLHVVWLQQFVDQALFPNDLIAQYYQTIQAVGYKTLYWIMAQLDVEPLLLAKLLPTLLALITTGYLFQLTVHLLPLPACGFLTTLLLNQNIWIKDDLISATPRAFVYPLFTAFLYYLVQQANKRCLTTIALSGLFYPQIMLVEIGVLTLRLISRLWHERGLPKSDHRPAVWLWVASLGVALLVMVPFQQSVTQQFGEILTAAQMQQMPEFRLHGRREYFGVAPLRFMFAGASGLRLPLFPPILWVSLALPFLGRTRLLAKFVASELQLLPQVGLASFGLFLLAHGLFPKLYLPSRYTFYSFRIIMAMAAGMVLLIGLEAGWRWWRSRNVSKLNNQIVAGFVIMFALIVAVVPAIPPLFLANQGWVVGTQTETYRFLAKQPKETRIASLATEADNIPAFTQRSVLVSRELALAYHPAFYEVMQQRIVDLIQAQYSADLAKTEAVIQKYGVDFWLLDRQFATPDYLTQQDWLIHSSFQQVVWDAAARLKQGAIPALSQIVDRCTVLSEDNLITLSANCISRVQSR